MSLAGAVEVFKLMNIGGLIATVVVVAVAGYIWGSGCGPVTASRNYGNETWYGAVELPAPTEAPAVAPHDEQAEAANARADELDAQTPPNPHRGAIGNPHAGAAVGDAPTAPPIPEGAVVPEAHPPAPGAAAAGGELVAPTPTDPAAAPAGH